MKVALSLVTCLFISADSFLKIPFGRPFSIKERELNQPVTHKFSEKEQTIINKINGFYGNIGPNVNINKVTNLFDLFFNDGVIQGVFFDNGELTYVKHFVRTEKLLYEEKNGEIPKNTVVILLFTFLHYFKLLPNLFGLANTAMININNKLYALYERDFPYLLDIDFEKKTLNTVKKTNIESISCFSAHSKCNLKSNLVETIDYQVLTRKVLYSQFDENFDMIRSKNIDVEYIPVVHDFLTTESKMIFFDCPICVNMNQIVQSSMPVILDKSKKSIIKMVDRNDMTVETFLTNESFYVFHFASYKEDDSSIQIFASLYDELDFSELNIVGKYRKININKTTKVVEIERNPELEKMDVDFPVACGDKTIFRRIENKSKTGLIVCKGLHIIKEILFEDNYICGEPAIYYADGVPYLFTFIFHLHNSNTSSLIIVNVDTYEKIVIPLNIPMNLGFHSIFLAPFMQPNDKIRSS